MQCVKTMLVGLGLGLGLMVSGCASGPHDAAGYTTIEKDGRLYVFVPYSGAHQQFQNTGEVGKSVTRIGAGPNGMTVVAEEAVKLDKYLAAAKKG